MLPLTQAEGSGVEADLRVQDPCFDLLGAGVPGQGHDAQILRRALRCNRERRRERAGSKARRSSSESWQGGNSEDDRTCAGTGAWR
jgi:hypothetical protein